MVNRPLPVELGTHWSRVCHRVSRARHASRRWRGGVSAKEFGQGVRLTDGQRLDWLRLIRSDNVGPRTFRALLNHYGSARAALDALPDLARRGGAARPRAHLLRRGRRARARGGAVARRHADRARRARLSARGCAMIDDAPPLLARARQARRAGPPMVAIVGSRNASAAGIKFAERIARELGEAGFVVVSGLARGIDAAAHRASLATGTVAVLAGGHDHIYPPEHAELLDAILADGAAITEMPLGWEPRAQRLSRAATGSFPAWRSASWWSRRRSAPAR